MVPLLLSGGADRKAQTRGSWAARTPGWLPVTAQPVEGTDVGRRILSVRGSAPRPPTVGAAGRHVTWCLTSSSSPCGPVSFPGSPGSWVSYPQ